MICVREVGILLLIVPSMVKASSLKVPDPLAPLRKKVSVTGPVNPVCAIEGVIGPLKPPPVVLIPEEITTPFTARSQFVAPVLERLVQKSKLLMSNSLPEATLRVKVTEGVPPLVVSARD